MRGLLLLAMMLMVYAVVGRAQDIDQSYQSATNDLTALYDGAQQLRSSLSDAQAQNVTLQQQLDALNAVKIFDHLEDNRWRINCSTQVGGSGLGTGSFAPPGIETAQQSIAPSSPTYFDCYDDQLFPAQNAYVRFSATLKFLFPSAADAAASQALEFEAPRQVVNGLMFICAFQFDFADNLLRYWDPVKKWTPTGIVIQRFAAGAWVPVVVGCHRDSTTQYYDSIIVSGVPHTLSFSYPAQSTAWTEQLKFATQLDGNGKGQSYRVKLDDLSLTEYQQ